jgi:hypothetical protein
MSEQVSKALKHHVLSSEFKALFHLQRHFLLFKNSAISLKHPVRGKMCLNGNSLRRKYAIIQGTTLLRHIDPLRADNA